MESYTARASVPFLPEMSVFFLLPEDMGSGCCLTAQDASYSEASVHVWDRHERIGGFQKWFGVDRCSERVNIPF